MRKTIYFLIGVFTLVVVSCKEQQVVVTNEEPATTKFFNTNNLLNNLEELASDKYEGRKVGSKGAEMARSFIKEAFNKNEVLPFTLGYEQTFKVKVKSDSLLAINILGKIKGTAFLNKYIVISAHYDHVGIKRGQIYNGADDNASGVSALIAFAEYFKKIPPKHSVILAAFDCEEYGLKGSEYFVEHAMKDSLDMVFNINMDMISRSKAKEIYAIGQLTQKELQPLIAGVNLPDGITIPKGHEGNDGKRSWLYASDHAPFLEQNIGALYFGVDNHTDYHKPTDDFERIDKNFYINIVDIIIQAFQAIDQFYK